MLDKRALILRCAARLFRNNGYAAVSMRNIAAEAAMTTGSLYYYFRQKDEIVAEILDTGHRRVHSEVMRAISELGPDASASERIRAGIRSHLGALFEEDGFPAANVRIFAHVPKHVRDQVRSSRHAYERYWTALLNNAEISEHVGSKELTMFLFGAANWTLEWYREGRDSLDEIAENLATVFFMSAAKKGASAKSVTARVERPNRKVA